MGDTPPAPYPFCPFPHDRQKLVDIAEAVARIEEKTDMLIAKVEVQNGRVGTLEEWRRAMALEGARAAGEVAGRVAVRQSDMTRAKAVFGLLNSKWVTLAVAIGVGTAWEWLR